MCSCGGPTQLGSASQPGPFNTDHEVIREFGMTRGDGANPSQLLKDEHLARLLDEVVRTHQPLAAYLLGSRAEGRALPENDDDLMEILPDDVSDEAIDVGRACEASQQANVPADVIPTTRRLFLACWRALYGAV